MLAVALYCSPEETNDGVGERPGNNFGSKHKNIKNFPPNCCG